MSCEAKGWPTEQEQDNDQRNADHEQHPQRHEQAQ